MYAPSVSLPKAAEVVNVGSVQVALPAEVGGGVLAGAVAAGVVGAELAWVGEPDGDVPPDEADGDEDGADADADADADGDDDARDRDEAPGAGVLGPVAVTVRSIIAECFALEAACRGT